MIHLKKMDAKFSFALIAFKLTCKRRRGGEGSKMRGG